MLKFKDYLTEAHDEVMPIDSAWLQNNLEKINSELDALTAKPYQNAPIFLNQLRGLFDRFGSMLPQSATAQFLNLSAELVYALGDSGYNLYVVYETKDDGYVDGYAQVVDNADLQDFLDMNPDEILGDREDIPVRHSDWYRKRDDDAGNSDEY